MAQFKDSDNQSISTSESDTATLTEEEWQENLAKLQKLLRKYDRAKKREDQETVTKLVPKIVREMRNIAETAPTSEARTEWREKTDAFEKAPGEEKDNMLLDIGKGLGIIIASPFLVAGGVLYGVGLLTKGLGNLLTGGAIGRLAN